MEFSKLILHSLEIEFKTENNTVHLPFPDKNSSLATMMASSNIIFEKLLVVEFFFKVTIFSLINQKCTWLEAFLYSSLLLLLLLLVQKKSSVWAVSLLSFRFVCPFWCVYVFFSRYSRQHSFMLYSLAFAFSHLSLCLREYLSCILFHFNRHMVQSTSSAQNQNQEHYLIYYELCRA